MKHPLLFVIWLGTSSLLAQPATTPFSLDSAASYLRVISVGIGPRPMGSPNERRAMEFALSKFRQFGLDDVTLMPMNQVFASEFQTTANTGSGIAVGVLKGKTDRVIVIGGHIDSAGPEIPGTNDDGSGSAAVLELARVLAQRKNESTFVFALFGGEEQGLRGSRYFVGNYPQIGKVSLMLQIDMANGSDWLVPLVDASKESSPEWLVRAAYEELELLGYTGLSYPSHFFSLMDMIPGGGVGSDHQPFLEKGIPAIDFTSDITDPIHTPQDNPENFRIGGLKRSGDLVYRLSERFDGGVPQPSTERYYLIQIGRWTFFLPLWLLMMFIFATAVLSVYVLVGLRSRRVGEQPRPSMPGLKLFAMMLIIQTCVWLSENVVGWVKGTRLPWFNEPGGYIVLGFLGSLVGIWISLQLAPRLSLAKDSYRYFLRAVITLAVFAALLALLSLKAALAAAMALFFLSLAMMVRSPFLRLLLWVLSPYFMYRLIFSEGFPLFARSIALTPVESVESSLLIHVSYILFFSVWSFPFLLGFAALRSDTAADLAWLNAFRKRAGGVVAAFLFAVWVLYLSTLPTYSQAWKQNLRLEERIQLDRGSGFVELISNDGLKGTRVHFDDRDTLIQDQDMRVRLLSFSIPGTDWIKIDRTLGTDDTSGSLLVSVKIRTRFRPYTLSLTYVGGREAPEVLLPTLIGSPGRNRLSLRWYSFPDTVLTIPLLFKLAPGDTIKEYVEATFVEQWIPCEVTKESGSAIKRTIISNAGVISLGRGPKNDSSRE